eukprot:TRINITY_DN2859_c2_g1_i2.p1 TRINITY_DN2859_c2_g1~~TRINITY_DN2859_c2_g1_i2.p1  ORF type:complete len:265 (+),score=25.37 TRINITY_DN2859_c2_g1_i2:162-956(+)
MKHWLYAGEINLTENEKKIKWQCYKNDYIAIPIVWAVYCLVGEFLGKCDGTPNKALMLFGAALATLVVYQDARVVITPLEEDIVMFKVQSILGKWVFLTRHILAFQSVHFTASLITPYSYGWSIIASGLTIFLTVQYFMLVHWNPEFIESCNLRQRRGIPFRAQMVWTHVPAGFLGVMDLFARDPGYLLEHSPYFKSMACVILVYALFYTGLIHKNFDATGEWPYAILDPLGKSISRWSAFIGGQTTILTGMVGIAYFLVEFRG